MSKFLTLFVLLLSMFCFSMSDAAAARFGGGRSFGAQRSISSYSRYQSAPRPIANNPAGLANKPWLAPLAGLAMGSILGYLMMGHGFGSGILTWLAIFAVLSILFQMLRPKIRALSSQAQFQGVQDSNIYDARTRFSRVPGGSSALPKNFDVDSFLREAKVTFIRLQASYDNKDLSDIREFTTSEVFAEVQMQMRERGDKPNKTEVLELEAELLDLSEEESLNVATVKFTGNIREEEGAAANRVAEQWHFRKDLISQRWIVSGVQQI